MRIALLRVLTVLSFVFLTSSAIAQQNPPTAAAPPSPPLKLTSTAFSDSSAFPAKYSCTTQPTNISPPLEWSDVPKDTASFVLIFHDMEPRPRKGIEDVLHWMVWNIPGSTTQLPEGVPSSNSALADGSRQTNGQPGNNANFGYRGPCAPPGIPHHYAFELFALDQKLSIEQEATRADIRKAMDGHILGHAVLIGLFHR